MAQIGMLVNHRNHENAEENLHLRKARDSPFVLYDENQDNFQCTYFRPRFTKSLRKTDESESSTDTEGESDNETNITTWLKTLPQHLVAHKYDENFHIAKTRETTNLHVQPKVELRTILGPRKEVIDPFINKRTTDKEFEPKVPIKQNDRTVRSTRFFPRDESFVTDKMYLDNYNFANKEDSLFKNQELPIRSMEHQKPPMIHTRSTAKAKIPKQSIQGTMQLLSKDNHGLFVSSKRKELSRTSLNVEENHRNRVISDLPNGKARSTFTRHSCNAKISDDISGKPKIPQKAKESKNAPQRILRMQNIPNRTGNVINKRIVNNKRLLKNMEEIIGIVNTSNATPKRDANCDNLDAGKPMYKPKECTIETKQIIRPIFRNPKLEKALDDAMLKTLKRCWQPNAWDYEKKNYCPTTKEPFAKKQKY